MPQIESVAPRRVTLLSDKDEPKLANLKTETHEPSRAKDRSDKEEPRDA